MKLKHADSEIIAHLDKTVIEMKVEKESSTTECEICMISKAHQIISQHSFMQSAEKSFEQIHWDLISMITVYNDDCYISHFYCKWTDMHHVYTQWTKTQNLQIFQQFVKYIFKWYDCKVKFVWLNEEITLLKDFKIWVLNENYIIE